MYIYHMLLKGSIFEQRFRMSKIVTTCYTVGDTSSRTLIAVCVCVCACVRARVRARVRACVRACVSQSVRRHIAILRQE